MRKNTRIKADDARSFSPALQRQLCSSEGVVGIGRIEGFKPDERPSAELWLPPNGRDVPGVGARIFHPGRRAALEAAGIDHHEALRRSEMSPAAIAAHNAAGDPDDDVGDEPPRFDDETATPVTEPGAAQ